MKFVALLSGGKDSIYSTVKAIENGHELVCCAHLAPRRSQSLDEESYMYQTAGSEAVRLQVEECIGVPFHVREISGRSRNTALVYDAGAVDDGEESGGLLAVADEVEDLYSLLEEVTREHPGVTAVSSGAILSTYQRTRIENVCSRLNLTSLSYLWRMSSQRSILDSILDDGGVEATLVRVACPPGLMPHRHLGKSLRDLRDRGILEQLKDRWGMHPAGEGGEYETLVLDCPRLFKRGRLVLEETEIVCDESDDGVGVLKIRKCGVEKKDTVHEHTRSDLENGSEVPARQQQVVAEQVRTAKGNQQTDGADERQMSASTSDSILLSMNLPNVRMMKGGLCHISALLSPRTHNQHIKEAEAAVQEFLSIRQMLQAILSTLYPNDQPPTSPQDVIYVHLYLSEISHFAKINQHYQEIFGTQLPPSRSCVAVGKGALPGGRRVMMDCILQRGSGGFLRSAEVSGDENGENCDTFLKQALQNKSHALRRTLHVQSISHWAPVCIGPYSQANVLRSSLVFLAGMIGLIPEIMTLIKPPHGSDLSGWEVQLYQCWKNAASVLDGLEDGGGKLDDCLGGLVYFSIGALKSVAASISLERDSDGSFPWNALWKTAECICNDAISTNAGVVMGAVDGSAADNSSTNGKDASLYDEHGVLYGGYEDEETWREMEGIMDAASPSSHATCENAGVPLLMVCLPELPANAEAEVELICASRRASSCLEVCNGPIARSTISYDKNHHSKETLSGGILWDTGYDGNAKHPKTNGESTIIELSSVARYVGQGCACVSTVMASLKPNIESDRGIFNMKIDVEHILGKMIDLAIGNAKCTGELGSLFTIGDILNVRLYHKAASVDCTPQLPFFQIEMGNDGSLLRTQLHSALQKKSKQLNGSSNFDESANFPAYTVVPVLGMHLVTPLAAPDSADRSGGVPLLSMQVTLADTTRMETEMWARHNRTYNTST